jgi:hypothetical protein
VVAIRTAALVLLIVSSAAAHASAYDYAPAHYVSNSVSVDVRISAAQSWQSPFTELIGLVLGIVPQAPAVTQVNISQVVLSVHRLEPDETYILVAAASSDIGQGVFDAGVANISSQVTLSGSISGSNCYFAVLVVGSYWNGTHAAVFNSISSENLVGPFSITPSITSPQSLVGIALVGGFSLLLIAGAYGLRKARSRTRRWKPLLEQ